MLTPIYWENEKKKKKKKHFFFLCYMLFVTN